MPTHIGNVGEAEGLELTAAMPDHERRESCQAAGTRENLPGEVTAIDVAKPNVPEPAALAVSQEVLVYTLAQLTFGGRPHLFQPELRGLCHFNPPNVDNYLRRLIEDSFDMRRVMIGINSNRAGRGRCRSKPGLGDERLGVSTQL